jgi:17 kDa outer membrane surface antigen
VPVGPSYSGRPQRRLWRACLRSAALALALGCGGCSFSYQLESLFGQKDDKSEPTSSIVSAQALGLPADSDLAYARAAVADVLDRGGKDISLPWENPRTGARGTVTPLATPYTQQGLICHDFLASYVRGGDEVWLQGEACRQQQGRWEVRSLKPWKRS